MKISQEKDTVSRARCALANSKIIVAILLKKILIWERDPFSKAPKTLELEGAPTIAVSSSVVFLIICVGY